jgi:hypothetical protein
VGFSVDSGIFDSGGTWAGLNADAMASHDVVMSFKAFPVNGRSKIEVAPVKKGMRDELKRSVEEGGYSGTREASVPADGKPAFRSMGSQISEP